MRHIQATVISIISEALGTIKKGMNPVDPDCRMYRLYLCKGVKPPPNECPGYDTTQGEGKAPFLEFWGV